MTIQASSPDNNPTADRAGIYDAPVVGRPLSKARDLADSLKPMPDDSLGVRAGKQIVRGSAVAGATGVAMIVLL